MACFIKRAHGALMVAILMLMVACQSSDEPSTTTVGNATTSANAEAVNIVRSVSSSLENAQIAVYLLANMERYAPYATVVSSQENIQLYAARREWEGFQFIIQGKRDTTVTAQWDFLRHRNGYEIDSRSLFRQRYIKVTTPTHFSPYPPQAYPDILLPVRENSTAIAPEFRAFPQRISKGENIPVWGDIFIPPDAPSGDYTGQITVIAGEERIALSIQLQVWHFTLPVQSPLRTVFGTNSFTVGALYQFDPDPNQSAERNLIIRHYNDLLLAHRLSPEDLWDASPRVNWENEQIDLQPYYAGLGSLDENLAYYRDIQGLSAYTYRFSSNYPFHQTYANKEKSQAYMLAYADWCQAKMGAARCYTDPSFIDEPDTPEAYKEVRKWGAYFDQIKPHSGQAIRFLVSEPPFASEKQLGNLYGAVDVWVGKFQDYWRDRELWQQNAAQQRLQQGEELWAYTALGLNFAEYRQENPQADALKGHYPPVWQLDFPPINYRIPTWLFHRYGITGLGYWDTIAVQKGFDPWLKPDGFRIPYGDGSGEYVFNGDGVLIYPGYQATTGLNEPIASLRLKWIRESVEDYIYIDLLMQQGEQTWVAREISRLARNYGDWENDPALLMQIRQRLGQRLHELSLTKAIK